MKATMGIHHLTAIVGDAQENVDFYAGVLGLRLVKKTVNFDDPKTYHFYFGDEGGRPGTIVTFFPWGDAYRGRIGDGQVGTMTFAIPGGSMSFWEARLAKFQVQAVRAERFGEMYLQFDDPHGLHLELVEREQGAGNGWRFGEITPETAIKGFAGAVLLSRQPEQTASVLADVMGLKQIAVEGEFIRFQSEGELGNKIDLKATTGVRGIMGVGTVHHIAWRAADDEEQRAWQEHVASHGYEVTDVRDRNYFNAIYFREHGSILFEIATDPPGFAHDESVETMGSELKLPEQYEINRENLEQTLPRIEVRVLD